MGSRRYLTKPMLAGWARAQIHFNLGDLQAASQEIAAAVGDQWRRYEPTGGAFGWNVRLTDQMPQGWAFLHYGTWNMLMHPHTYDTGFTSSAAITVMRELSEFPHVDRLHHLDTDALATSLVDDALYRASLPDTLSPEDLLDL